MINKGFTLIEILIVLSLILIIFSTTSQIFKPLDYLKKSRDIKRISDLKSLEIAINTYLLSTSSPNLGPSNKAVDEINPTIFISVPFEKEDIRNQTLIWNSKTYYFSQSSSTDYLKNNGLGWIPINLTNMIYQPLFSYPVDPINSYNNKFFYSYIFKKSDSTFEINANLEYQNYKFNGIEDKTSSDTGDNLYILEAGNNKTLMPNNLY